MNKKLKRTKQCSQCPWIKNVDPTEIPNGYSLEKHKGLQNTIADPNNVLQQMQDMEEDKPLNIMSCHETFPEEEVYCIGWLMNQINKGNNVRLRIEMEKYCNLDQITILDEQWANFDQTVAHAEQCFKKKSQRVQDS